MQGKTGSIVAFGELLWDVLPTGRVLGGAPANFGVRMLELGASVSLVSRIGNDLLGDEAVQILSERGIDISLLQRDPSLPTGTVDVVLRGNGDPSYTINKGVAYDNIELSDALVEGVKGAKLVCFGTLVQRAEPTRETLYAVLDACPAPLKFLDINLRRECHSELTIRESLKRADVLKLNRSEIKIVADLLHISSSDVKGFCMHMIEHFNLKTCVVTLGEEGATGVSSSGEIVTVKADKVNVIDSIGAGDAFSAGFATQLLAGGSLDKALSMGNMMGGLATSTKGGMDPISPEVLQASLTAHGF